MVLDSIIFRGWVSPEGRFHGCDNKSDHYFSTHIEAAEKLIDGHDPAGVLIRLGWMKVSPRGVSLDVQMDSRPTQAQIDYVWAFMLIQELDYFYLDDKAITFRKWMENV